MLHKRVAYLPLMTYPEPMSDESVRSAARFAEVLGCDLHASAFEVTIPQISTPLARLLVDVPGLVKTAEERSRNEGRRLLDVVRGAAGAGGNVECSSRTVVLGGVLDSATEASRLFDVTLLPWASGVQEVRDLTQAAVFGSGRPALLVPPADAPPKLKHLAVAWDGSRVAARALWDALPFVEEGGVVSVLTVRDEKPLTRTDLAAELAAFLQRRGVKAQAIHMSLSERGIAEALQCAALDCGAQMLAMGGFGHSRLRDFVLGGATDGVLKQLLLPVLLSH